MCVTTDDASRVILSVPDADGSDYINASYIDVCFLHMQIKSHPMGFCFMVMCTRYTVLIIQTPIDYHVQSSKYNGFQRMLLFLYPQSIALCVMSNLVPSCTCHLYVGC